MASAIVTILVLARVSTPTVYINNLYCANVSCLDMDKINDNSDPDSDCCLQGDYWHQVLVTISVASLAPRQDIFYNQSYLLTSTCQM